MRELFPKRTSNNVDSNTLLQMLKEFLNLVGYGITIYELVNFFKKHGVPIVKIAFYCMSFPIFACIFLPLRELSPKEYRGFFNIHKVFKHEFIREVYFAWFFSVLLKAFFGSQLPTHSQ